MSALNIIHYVNTHFASLGDEEMAGMEPKFFPWPPEEDILRQTKKLEKLSSGQVDILFAISGGDDYVNENEEKAIGQILEIIQGQCYNSPDSRKPDVFLAGPCFGAGRYGNFCQALSGAVSKKFGIPSVTGMHPDNPGAAEYRNGIFDDRVNTYVVKTSANVSGTDAALKRMVALAAKLANGDEVRPKIDGYIPQGRRVNVFSDKSGARRAIEMLLRKMRGEPVVTELPIREIPSVTPAPALTDLSTALIAIGTTGGIVPAVPVFNPDNIPGASAQNWGLYSIEGLESLTKDTHQTVHLGYTPGFANENPNCVLPLDIGRKFEKAGIIGKLFNKYFVTVGNATEIAEAERMAGEVAAVLKAAGVQAAIFTST